MLETSVYVPISIRIEYIRPLIRIQTAERAKHTFGSHMDENNTYSASDHTACVACQCMAINTTQQNGTWIWVLLYIRHMFVSRAAMIIHQITFPDVGYILALPHKPHIKKISKQIPNLDDCSYSLQENHTIAVSCHYATKTCMGCALDIGCVK